MNKNKQDFLVDDEGLPDDQVAVSAWKFVMTEEDRIDAIAERDAKAATQKMKEAFERAR